jgi:AcrR family transcriptional regulator
VTQSDPSPERERIMAAAYDLLAASGGTSVSVSDILARAELSTRAFYRHFDSRDELLTAMFRRDSDHVVSIIRSQVAAAPTGRAALEAWISAMLELSVDPRRRLRAVVLTSQEVSRARSYREEQEHYQAIHEEALADILTRGREDGTLPLAVPASDASHIGGALHQALGRLMSGVAMVPAAEVTSSLLDFVLRALTGTGANGLD